MVDEKSFEEVLFTCICEKNCSTVVSKVEKKMRFSSEPANMKFHVNKYTCRHIYTYIKSHTLFKCNTIRLVVLKTYLRSKSGNYFQPSRTHNRVLVLIEACRNHVESP
jgi:hypothetical protein